MLQTQLLKRIEKTLAALAAAETLTQVVDSINKINDGIKSELKSIARNTNQDGSKFQNSANSIHSILAALKLTTSSISARTLFLEIAELRSGLYAAMQEGQQQHELISSVNRQLDFFATAYDNYIAHQTAEAALPLVIGAQSLKQTLIEFQSALEYVKGNFSDSLGPNANETELSLTLTRVDSLEEFIKKLAAINCIYAELCMILNISTPLRISKIESGSLWIRIFGDTKVIDLATKFLEGAARYFHNNYTTEGKISAIPHRIDSMNSILDFSNKLKESGVDVTNLNDELIKGAVVLAKNLNALIEQQPLMEINGKEFSIGGDAQSALLKQPVIPRLENSLATDEPQPSAHQDENGAA
ncbi:MAG: hypothetical protein H6R19_596 [Proteobacteria bacterium]|nr:hypothetical protein [Pseudomonadota bacterium]